MHLVLNNNIFFEFVPFDETNFDSEGNMVDEPEALMIHEIEEQKDYALLISTNAGAWRYAIGDTVKLVNRTNSEIIITGRTKHFLSLVGEHLSVDNMNKAIEMVSAELNISIPEFTVAGIPHNNFFAHQWYLATDDKTNADDLRQRIDDKLKELNDDYEIERKYALKDKGKIGGQHKFPRVLKGSMLKDWQSFLDNY